MGVFQTSDRGATLGQQRRDQPMDLVDKDVQRLARRLKPERGTAPKENMVRAAVLFARGKRPVEAATAVNPAVPAGSRGNISVYGERVKGFHPDMWQSCVLRLQETQPSQESMPTSDWVRPLMTLLSFSHRWWPGADAATNATAHAASSGGGRKH